MQHVLETGTLWARWSRRLNQSIRSRQLVLGCCFALALLCAPSLMAQIATGGLTGTVKDSSGAVISGVKVTLTNTATRVFQVTQSTSTGTYVFRSVKPGTYTLRAEETGFKTFVGTNIQIHLQQNPTIDVTLSPGTVNQQVTVTAAAPLLQTEDASIGQTIGTKLLNDLPLNGRNWASLAQLSAGVTTASVWVAGQPGSAFFATNGGNVWQTDFRLNGIDDNVEVYGGPGVTNTNANVTPPPDAVQEFKLQTGDFSAQFGHSTGGIVNAVVKSGTNSFHGDLWEYLRNKALDANNYFAVQNGVHRGKYRTNQFGGTLGGPVLIPRLYNGRDKTFFFFSYQGFRHAEADPDTQTVPTATMASSGFTNLQDLLNPSFITGTKQDGLGRNFLLGTVFDPATTRLVTAGSVDPVTGLQNTSGSDVYVRDPFYTGGSIAGITDFTTKTAFLNMLPEGRLDPNAVKLLGVYPAPTNGGLFNNYFATPNSTQNTDQIDLRIDQSFGSHDSLFGVYDWSHTNALVPNALPGIADGGNYGTGTNFVPAYAIALGETHVFSPTLTNDAHLGWNQNIERQISENATTMGIPAQFGIQGVPQVPNNGGLPSITVSGFTNLGISSSMPTFQTISSLEFMDNLTKIHGSQTFTTGFQIDRIKGAILQPPIGRGQFDYSGQWSDIPNAGGSGVLGVADLLLIPGAATVPNGVNDIGGMSWWQASNIAPANDHRYYYGAYFQDDWKVTPNLTLNLGLRWDHYTPYAEVNGRQANFVANNGNGNTANLYIPKQGCAVPRSATYDQFLVTDHITLKCVSNKAVGEAQNFNLAPRIGFALRATPHVAIRGGYGITYGALANIGFSPNLGNNYPFSFVQSQFSQGSQNPFYDFAGNVAVMETVLKPVSLQDPTKVWGAGINLIGRQYDFQTPYTQTFNLTTQYQFSQHDAVQLAYVGTVGRHLDNLGSVNDPSVILPPGTPIYPYIPFPDFNPGAIYETTNGTSSYNSMQLTYQHQTSYGLSMLANYTLSKCMTNQAAEQTNNWQGYRAQWLPGFGIVRDYSLCDTDAPSVVHVSGTYLLPIGRNSHFLGNINRFENAIVGGWQVNYIYTFQSGQPFTVSCPVQTTSDFGCYADVVQGQGIYKGGGRQTQWMNPNAFSNPPVATAVGQSDYSPLGGSPNQARGPHFNNIDFSLFKDFSIEPIGRLEFRAETFNLTNTPQFGMPGNLDFRNSQNFSVITGLRNNPRLVQLALKLYY